MPAFHKAKKSNATEFLFATILQVQELSTDRIAGTDGFEQVVYLFFEFF